MDSAIIFIFLVVCINFVLRFHYVYFARGAKISDGQLMQNYIIRTQKINNKNYFPNITIKGDF